MISAIFGGISGCPGCFLTQLAKISPCPRQRVRPTTASSCRISCIATLRTSFCSEQTANSAPSSGTGGTEVWTKRAAHQFSFRRPQPSTALQHAQRRAMCAAFVEQSRTSGTGQLKHFFSTGVMLNGPRSVLKPADFLWCCVVPPVISPYIRYISTRLRLGSVRLSMR